MTRLVAWLARYGDSGLALVLAVGAGFVSLATPNYLEGAILLAIGLIATAILRDRSREEAMDSYLRDVLGTTASVLATLPARLDALEATVGSTQQALREFAIIQVLHGGKVGEALEEARRNTDRWVFKGGTGTYLRAVTLPECVAIARRKNHALHVQMEILDPSDEQVCTEYAQFRRSLSGKPDATGEIWTVDRTRKESYATVLAACWYAQHYTFVTIEVGLSGIMTTFRWDMTPHRLIITQEDPHLPAIMLEPGKHYYEIYARELMTSMRQSRKVPISNLYQAELSDEPTVDEARKLFSELELPLPRTFTDRDVAELISKALQPRNPYER